MSDYRELLLGCGNSREKLLGLGGEKLEWRESHDTGMHARM